jgi:hypothetical protein
MSGRPSTTATATPGPEPICRVVFRTYRQGGDVIAILLDAPATPGYVLCYQHVGQHGEGKYFTIMAQTRPATAEEYAPLKRELEGVTYRYRLALRKRRTVRL